MVLTALFALPLMINWDNYRQDFEVRLSEILGSKVELDGSLNVRLLPTPYVRVEGLRVGESGVEAKPVLDVKEFTLWVSVPPLLKGVIEASRLTLNEPRVLLQFDERGRPKFKTKTSKSAVKSKPSKRGTRQVRAAALSGFQLSPNLISLKDVRILDGKMVLQTRAGARSKQKRRLSFENIDGSLSAVTLNGPFYFNGTYKIWDMAQRLRLAIGKREDSSFPIEAKVTLPQGQRFDFKGGLTDARGAWHGRGTLKAGLGLFGREAMAATRLPTDVRAPDAEKKLSGDGTVIGVSKSPGFQEEAILTSLLDVSAKGLDFQDILLRGGNLAQPQTVRGRAQIGWGKVLSLTTNIEGRVVDLNMLQGVSFDRKSAFLQDREKPLVRQQSPGDKRPYIEPGVAFMNFSDGLLAGSGWFDSIDVQSKISQVIVGRGEVRDFSLKVKGNQGVIKVEEFYGRLPGAGRISLKGGFDAKAGAPHFDGALYLRGLQFEDLLQWATSRAGGKEIAKGKYMLSGKFSISEAGFALQEGHGIVGGAAMRGGFEIMKPHSANGEGGAVQPGYRRLSLNAGEVVLENLLGRPVLMKDYKAALASVLELGGVGILANEVKRDDADKSVKRGDFQASEVEFTIEKLVFSDAVQRDVAVVWRAEAARSGIVSLQLESEQGLRVVYDNGGSFLNERDNFVIEAIEGRAVAELVQLAGLDPNMKADAIDLRVAARLLPMRLAVQRQIKENAVLYRVDGVMAGSDAAFSLLVPGREDGAVVTLFGGMENQNGAKLASLLLPFQTGYKVRGEGQNDLSPVAGDRPRARLTFAATGTIRDGFKGQLRLEDRGFSMSYDGALGVKGGLFASDGLLRLEGERSRDVLSIFGLGGVVLSPQQVGQMTAEAKFAQTDDGYAISDLNVLLGETVIRGTGLIEEGADGSLFRLALAAEQLDLRSILVPLENADQQSGGGDGGGSEVQTLWSSRLFKTKEEAGGQGNNARGRISLVLNELQLTDQLSLENAQVVWALDGDRIEISKVEGQSLGGKFLGSGSLRPVANGYSFNGRAQLLNARLEEVGARSEVNIGSGEFSLNLSLSGVGRSLNDLVSSLVGEGSLGIEGARLRQLSPAKLRSVAIGYLGGSIERTESVKTLIEGEIDRGNLIKIGPLDFALQLIDGVVKLKQPDLGVRPGRIGVEAALKLEDLSWSGEWVIGANQAKGQLVDLPPIYRRVKGKLTLQDPFVSEVDMGDFLRHLDLKSKEKEIKALEKSQVIEDRKRLARERELADEELQKLEAQRKKLKQQQKKIDEELERTDLSPLTP